MRFLAGLATILAAFVAFGFGGSASASDDVFVVARIPVQAQAASATEAKSEAQADGRRRAMDQLLRRLTPEADWIYLPTLASGAAARASADPAGKRPIAIGPRELEALEGGFEVYDEKSSASVYRAYITYRFKPDGVRRLLKAARLPYSEAQTRTALVLPVLQTDSGVYLWESNNPWMAAWKARPYTHELTPMIAPLGDLEDASKVSANGALALDAGGLGALAAHYRVAQVIVAHARLRRADGQDQVRVRLINAFEAKDAPRPVDDSLEDDLGPQSIADTEGSSFSLGAGRDADAFGGDVGDVVAEAYLSEAAGNFPRLAEKLIDASITKYASGWKNQTLIDHAAEAVLGASAFFDGVEDWSRIRSSLIATPLVGGVQVSALSRRGAEMEIRVFGDPTRLQVALENQGVVFWTETGERWFLATPSVASRYRGRRILRNRRGLFGEEGGFAPEPGEPVPASIIEEPAIPSKIEQPN